MKNTLQGSGKTRRVRRGVIFGLSLMMAGCLTLGVVLPFVGGNEIRALGLTPSTTLNANIGLHPQVQFTATDQYYAKINRPENAGEYVELQQAESYKLPESSSGIGAGFTTGTNNIVYRAYHTDYDTYKTEHPEEDISLAQYAYERIVEKYELHEGENVVFYADDPDNVSIVWEDAVIFSLVIGSAQNTAISGSSRNFYGNMFLDGNVGQYVTVRLNCDWIAKDITGNLLSNSKSITTTTFHYTSKPADLHTAPNAVTQSSNGYSAAYDRVYTANNCTDDSYMQAFSFGRPNVPSGAYVVLDLNGHTMDRGLAESTKKQGYLNNDIVMSVQLKGATARDLTIDYGKNSNYYNAALRYGSVMQVDSHARLEVYDGAAYENASRSRIENKGTAKETSDYTVGYDASSSESAQFTTNHPGTMKGGWVHAMSAVAKDDKNKPYPNYEPNDYTGYDGGNGGGISQQRYSDVVWHSGTMREIGRVGTGGAISLTGRAVFTLYDGYFVDNYSGGWDSNVTNGTTNGGTGGVVYAGGDSAALFYMQSGVLAYNTGDINISYIAGHGFGGGAVQIAYGSGFILKGGEIVGNVSVRGGAINISPAAECIIDSVTITENVAAGGSTTGKNNSKGGGIFIPGRCACPTSGYTSNIKIAGSLQVYGNCAVEGSTALENNVHFENTSQQNSGIVYKGGGINGDLKSITWGGGEDHHYVIKIAGDLISNGIAANIGITLDENSSSGVTSGYWDGVATISSGFKDHNNGLSADKLFFADRTGSHFSTGSNGEAYLNTDGSIPTQFTKITWVVEGTATALLKAAATESEGTSQNLPYVTRNQGGAYYYEYDEDGKPKDKDNDGVIDAKDATLYGYVNTKIPVTVVTDGETVKQIGSNGTLGTGTENGHTVNYQLLYGAASAETGIQYDWKNLLFEFGMFNVTKVSAYTGYTSSSSTGTLLASWSIAAGTGAVTKGGNTELVTTFKPLMGEEMRTQWGTGTTSTSYTDKDETAFFHATGDSISYAGNYGFAIGGTAHYDNPKFNITINRIGVEATTQKYYNGQTATNLNWVEDVDYNDGTTDHFVQNEEVFYYSGTDYVPILESEFNEDSFASKKATFSGYVLRFKYANSNYFGDTYFSFSGSGVEYVTTHRKPTETGTGSNQGTQVSSVRNAGFYSIQFRPTSSGTTDTATGVDYAANNFAFSSRLRLYVKPAEVSVGLTANAKETETNSGRSVGVTYNTNQFDDAAIVQLNNNSRSDIIPHDDGSATVFFVSYSDFEEWTKGEINAETAEALIRKHIEVRNAGHYVALVIQTKSEGYDDYNYTFTQREEGKLTLTKDQQKSFNWAYEFYVNPIDLKTNTKAGGDGFLGQMETDLKSFVFNAQNLKASYNVTYTDSASGRPVRFEGNTDGNGDPITTTPDFIVYYGLPQTDGTIRYTAKETPFNAGTYNIFIWFGNAESKAYDTYDDSNLTFVDGENPFDKDTKHTTGNAIGSWYGQVTINPVEVNIQAIMSYTYNGSQGARGSYDEAQSTTNGIPTYTNYPTLLSSWNRTIPANPSDDVKADHTHPYNARGIYDLSVDMTITYNDSSFIGPIATKDGKYLHAAVGLNLYYFNTGNPNAGMYGLQLITNGIDDGIKYAESSKEVTSESAEGFIVMCDWNQQLRETNDQTVLSGETQHQSRGLNGTADGNFTIASGSMLTVNILQKDLSVDEEAGETFDDLFEKAQSIGDNKYRDTSWHTHVAGDERDKDPSSHMDREGVIRINPNDAFEDQPLRAEVYTGGEIEPDTLTLTYRPIVRIDRFRDGQEIIGWDYTIGTDRPLQRVRDYYLSYSKNVNVGKEAEVLITGIGNYKGSRTVKFEILPAAVMHNEERAEEYIYNGTDRLTDHSRHIEDHLANVSKDYYLSDTYKATEGATEFLESDFTDSGFSAPKPSSQEYAWTGVEKVGEAYKAVSSAIDVGEHGFLVYLTSSNYVLLEKTADGGYKKAEVTYTPEGDGAVATTVNGIVDTFTIKPATIRVSSIGLTSAAYTPESAADTNTSIVVTFYNNEPGNTAAPDDTEYRLWFLDPETKNRVPHGSDYYGTDYGADNLIDLGGLAAGKYLIEVQLLADADGCRNFIFETDELLRKYEDEYSAEDTEQLDYTTTVLYQNGGTGDKSDDIIFTITAAALSVTIAYYALVYDPKKLFFLLVTATDSATGISYQYGYEAEDAKSDEKNQNKTRKGNLIKNDVFTVEFTGDGDMKEGTDGMPTAVGTYTVKIKLTAGEGANFTLANANADGDYTEQFSITEDLSHDLYFNTGLDEKANVVGAHALPLILTDRSFGQVNEFNSGYTYYAPDGKVYTLIGWTKKNPADTTAYKNGYVLSEELNWDDTFGTHQTDYWVIDRTRLDDGDYEIPKYTVNGDLTSENYDPFGEDINFYGIWGRDYDQSTIPDWSEAYDIHYADGLGAGISSEMKNFPSNPGEKYIAGDVFTVAQSTGTGENYRYFVNAKDNKRYMLFGWTILNPAETKGTNSVLNKEYDYKDGFLVDDSEDLLLIYNVLGTVYIDSYTIDSRHEQSDVITLYAIWVTDTNDNGEPDFDAQRYTVTFTDDTTGDNMSSVKVPSPVVGSLEGVQIDFVQEGKEVYFTNPRTKTIDGRTYALLGWTTITGSEFDDYDGTPYVANTKEEVTWYRNLRRVGDEEGVLCFFDIKANEVDGGVRGGSYTIRGYDDDIFGTDKDGNIILYAVWGLSEDGNDKPDWLETPVELTYTSTEKEGITLAEGYTYEMQNFHGISTDVTDVTFNTFASEGEVTDHALANKTITLPGKTQKDGKDVWTIIRRKGEVYLVVGWTTDKSAAKGYVFQYTATDTDPAQWYTENSYYSVGGSFTVPEGGATLYAVWAADANNNGTPDYLESYTLEVKNVVDNAAAGGTVGYVGSEWQDVTVTGETLGNTISMRAGYTLTVTKGENIENYVLVGFTSAKLESNGGYLVTENPSKDMKFDRYVAAGENYAINAKDDDNGDGVITYYAVWGIDANKDGQPDWNNIKVQLRYEWEHNGLEEGEIPEGLRGHFPMNLEMEYNIGEQVELPTKTLEELYFLRTGTEAPKYILLGWTTDSGLSTYVFDSKPRNTILGYNNGADGGRDKYTISANDVTTDGSDNVVILYAVWGVDANESKVPDWDDVYTSSFEKGAMVYGTEEDPHEYEMTGSGVTWGVQKDETGAEKKFHIGDEVGPLPYSTANNQIYITVGGAHYVLVGWSPKQEIPLLTSIEGYAGDIYKGSYTLNLYDDKNKNGNLELYAVWGLDENGSGIVDWEENTITVVFDYGDKEDVIIGGNLPETYANIVATTVSVLAPSGLTLYERSGLTVTGRYTLLGWSYENNENNNLFDSTPDIEMVELRDGNYVIDKIHLSGTTITLYAVWGIDLNGNRTPDYEDKFTVRFDAGGATDVTLPTEQSGLSVGASVTPSGEFSKSFTAADGKKYTLFGWSLTSGTHLLHEAPASDLIEVRVDGNYTVDAAHADSSNVITLYSVWAIDENENGTPDYREKITVVFKNGPDSGETLDPTNGWPNTITVGPAGSMNLGDIINLPAAGKLKLLVGEDNYMLLGWSLKAGERLYSAEPEEGLLIASPYVIDINDAVEGTITLYAQWGIDKNDNGTPDYAEAFTVIYSDDVEPTATTLPPSNFGKKEGEAIIEEGGTMPTMPAKEIDGVSYVLLGWTTEKDTAKHKFKTAEGKEPSGLPELYEGSNIYKIRATDYDPETHVVTLYAVWGVDQNGDGIVDWDDTRYSVHFRDGERAVYVMGGAEPTLYRVGDTVTWDEASFSEFKTEKVEVGKHYILLGWTADSGLDRYYVEAEPTATIYTGSKGYTILLEDVEGFNVTLYAVWAIDQDHGGDGNDTPDWQNEYTVFYTKEAEGTLTTLTGESAEFKQDETHYHVGEMVIVPSGYVLTVGEGSAAKRYVLVGWSLTAGEHLYAGDTSYDHDREIFNASTPYQMAAEDADELQVTLHAVWAEDANGNNIPDYDEIDRYYITYENGLTSSEEGAVSGKLPKDSAGYLVGTVVPFAGKDGDSWKISVEHEGKRYVLVGWSSNALASQFFDGEPVGLGTSTYFEVGASYVLDVNGIAVLNADESKEGARHYDITLYAVWAADNENQPDPSTPGTGDEKPDYLQTYLVRYTDAADGTAETLGSIGSLRVGGKVDLRSDFTREGYVLVGWSTRALSNYLLDGSTPFVASDTMIAAGGEYTVSAGDALKDGGALVKDGNDYVIVLYAVWGVDENGNGTHDVLDERFDLHFEKGFEGEVEGDFPENLEGKLVGETVELAGKEGDEWNISYVKDGVRYVLVGWTTTVSEEGHFFEGEPTGLENYREAGATLTFAPEAPFALVEGRYTATFYAVWAEDNEAPADPEGPGTGDKTPDYLQAYTLRYENKVELTDGDNLNPGDLPYDNFNQKAGTVIPTRSNYTLTVGGVQYVLIGWSKTELAEYLLKARPADGGFIAAGATYTVSAADASLETTSDWNHIISLYAVWGVDENGNGKVDWLDEFRLRYTTNVNGTVTPDGDMKYNSFHVDTAALTDGEEVPLLTGYTLELGGETFKLLGWTLGASETPLVRTAGEEPAGLIKEGENYTVDFANADGECYITFYAVWAIDNNSNDTPDYEETYTVGFSYGKNVTRETDSKFTDITKNAEGGNLSLGDNVKLHARSDLFETDGKQYALMGWTLTPGDYLCDSLQDYNSKTGSVTIYGMGEDADGYTVSALDDCKDGAMADAHITFYAIWGLADSESGKPAWETYTVIFEDLAGENRPAGQSYDISGPSWPLTQYGLALADDEDENLSVTNRALGNSYALSIYESGAIKEHYTFIGWTTQRFDTDPDKYLVHSEDELNDLKDSGVYFEKTKNTFSIPVTVADGSNNIYLFAVWAIDNNNNGEGNDKPDWEEQTFEISFVNPATEESVANFPEKMTDVLEGTKIELAGKDSGKWNISFVDEAGTKYVLVGWTTQELGKEGCLFTKEPTGLENYFEAGAIYTATTDAFARLEDGVYHVTFYAVWATDTENGGTGDNMPDYLQEYTARFDNTTEGTTNTTVLPFNVSNLKEGETLKLYEGYVLTSGEKRYILIGWTIGDESFIAEAAPTEETFFAAGDSYTVSAADADESGVIHFHAVWAADMNGDGTGNGTPDYLEDRYAVKYELHATVSEFDASAENKEGLLSGDKVTLPGLGVETQYLYETTHEADGTTKHYLLIGWTKEAGEHFFAGEPTVDFYPIGATYAVDPADATEKVITFYAVWAADNENRTDPDGPGTGDKTPDYLQEYTVEFVNTTESTPSPDDLPYTLQNLSGGAQVNLLGGHTLEVDGVNYVLVGWTLKKEHAGAFEGTWEEDAVMVSPYTVDAGDADATGTISFYAIWAVDVNNNGTPDVKEQKYELAFDNSIGSSVSIENFPAGETDVLPGLARTLAGRGGSDWNISYVKDGVRYVLVGWTTERLTSGSGLDSDKYFFTDSDPSERFNPLGTLYRAAGTVYYVSAADANNDKLEGNADDNVITFYAVWAADNESPAGADGAGTGDKIPDYLQSYTVEFRHDDKLNSTLGATPTIDPALPYVLEKQTVGTEMALPAGYRLTVDGKHYVLAGWRLGEGALAADDDMLPLYGKDGDKTLYKLASKDAAKDEEGNFKVVFYAVWEFDENNDGEADSGQVHYDVYLANDIVGLDASVLQNLLGLLDAGTNTLPGLDVELGEGYYSTAEHKITVAYNGKNYVLVGWTNVDTGKEASHGFYIRQPDVNVYKLEYIVATNHALKAADLGGGALPDGYTADDEGYVLNADGRRVINLYPVFGLDENDSGVAEFEENTYTLYLRYGMTLNSGKVIGDAHTLPAEVRYNLPTDTVDLSDYVGMRFEKDGCAYQLIGWKRAEGDYFAQSEEIVPDVEKTYKGFVTDDEDGDFAVYLYAVWAIDNNNNGEGNNIPDYDETFEVVYSNLAFGDLTKNGTSTAFPPIDGSPFSGSALWGEEPATVTLLKTGDGYRLRVAIGANAGSYMLLGWTLTPGEHLYQSMPSFEVLTDTYRVSSGDAIGNLITLYAVWAIDNNGDDQIDDTFSVKLNASIPDEVHGSIVFDPYTDLKVGDLVTGLPASSQEASIYIERDGLRYVLVGWTTERPTEEDGHEHVYRRAPGSNITILPTYYTVAAVDDLKDGAADRTITLYAVWGADENNSGLADWSEDLYYATFINEAEGTLGHGGEILPYTLSGVVDGMEIALLKGFTLQSGDNRFTLLGWTRDPDAEYLYTSAPEALSDLMTDVYTVRGGDADRNHIIRLYAVWGVDNNGNGVADYLETFTVRYANGATGGVLNGAIPASVTIEAGKIGSQSLTLPAATLRLAYATRNYALVGWTLTVGLHVYDLAPMLSYEAPGAAYTPKASDDTDGDGVIVLYAVWGIDENEGGNGNNTPDWLDEFTVNFLPGVEGTLTQGDSAASFRRNTGKKVGDRAEMPEGTYHLTVGSGADEKNYVLIGWTLTPGEYLCSSFTEFHEVEGLFTEYVVNARDAKGNEITMYAVWGIDTDLDDTPDWEDENRVVFLDESGGTVEGGLPSAIPVDDGMRVNLAPYNGMRLTLDGKSYVLVGWTLTSGAHLTDTAEQLAAIADLMNDHFDVDLTMVDEEGSINLYAVWGADVNHSGKADWEDTYSVHFTNLSDGTMEGSLPESVRDLALGATVTIDSVGTMKLVVDLGGTTMTYVLVGWTTERGEHLVVLEEDLPESLLTESYVVAAENADSNNNILLYAVWGVDENGNGEPDWAETRYTVALTNGSEYEPSSEDAFVRYESVLEGLSVGLGTDEVVSLAVGETRYVLAGWTLVSGENLYDALPDVDYMTLNERYTVNSADAQDGVITLYAVWGVDNNGNDIPDWAENLTLRFVSVHGTNQGELTSIEGVEIGAEVDLPETPFTTTVDGVQYVILGWTRDSNEAKLYSEAPSMTWESSPYTVEFEHINSHCEIIFYAVWGIDENRNETPDWEETFTVYLTNRAEGVTSQTISIIERNKSLGDEVSIDYSFTLEFGGRHYVLIGWTTAENDPEGYHYGGKEGPRYFYYDVTEASVYHVSAGDADAGSNYIFLYALWAEDMNNGGEGDDIPDFRQTFITFIDELGVGETPSDIAYVPGGTYPLADAVPEDSGLVEFLGWTESEEVGSTAKLSRPDGLLRSYTVPESAKGVIKLYAVWNVRAEIADRTYGDEADGTVNALESNVENGTLYLRREGSDERIEVVVRSGNLKAALLEALAPDLDAGSYLLENGSRNELATFGILARALEVRGLTALNKQYDGTAAASVDYSGASLFEILFDDDVTLDSSAASALFDGVSVGRHGVTVSGLALAGPDAGNYYLAVPELSAEISKAVIDGSSGGHGGGWSRYLRALDKEYDGTTDAKIVFSDRGWMGGFDLAVESYEAHFEDENVGENKRVYVTLHLSGNDAGNVTFGENGIVLYADIWQTENAWVVEWGRSVETDDGTLQGPVSKWGTPEVEYFLDRECTQRYTGDLADLRGRYFVRVTVKETINYTGLEAVYETDRNGNVIGGNGETNEEESLDISLCVSLAALQVVFLVMAGIVVGSSKKKGS